MTYAIGFIVGVSVGAWVVSWWASRGPRDEVAVLVQLFRDTHCLDCRRGLDDGQARRCADCAAREHSWMRAIK